MRSAAASVLSDSPRTGSHGHTDTEASVSIGRFAPRRTCVRMPAATLTTSPPSMAPMRSLLSRQSTSAPMPVTGLMLPPHACRKSAVPPSAPSTTSRAAPGKSEEATCECGPIVTGWQP